MTFPALGPRPASRLCQHVVFLLLLGAPPCHAARMQIAIDPASTQIAYTVYALGFFPVPAQFAEFGGTLTADPANPETCDIHVVVQVASLRMADAARTAQALGPAMLDAARYPTMRFDGNCADGGIAGTLTLHGISNPLRLSKQQDGPAVVSTGTLQRGDYGVSGMPYLIGARVLLRFRTRLPATLAQP